MSESVRSPDGAIVVRTTERGIPVELWLDPDALKVPPEQLAHDVLAVCRVSAARAQVRRRQHLIATGCGVDIVQALNLSSVADLAEAEAQLPQGDQSDLPQTWRSPV